MKSKFNAKLATNAISNLKEWYPEIAEIIEDYDNYVFQNQEPDHIIDICAMLRIICNKYRRDYQLQRQELAKARKIIEQIGLVNCLSVDDYKELEKITNKIVSCRLDKVTLNLNNGVSIVFDPPTKDENDNI